jgi:hypothetical protein
MYKGSCLCGGIQYEIDGELEPIQICHCSQCRKAQGSAIVTNIPVAVSAFTLQAGEELLSSYESSPGKQRVFCKVCGSPIYSKRVDLPEVLRVRAGTIDGELRSRPAAHFHVGSRANWYELNDSLPKFSEGSVK